MRRLYYFKIVAEELHFHRAAELLDLSQPALTRQIGELERDLGVQLFDRTKRRVRLTNAGTELLAGVRRMLDQFDDATRRARDAESGHSGALVIGAVGMTMVRMLPRVLQAFRSRYPGVSTDLQLFRSGDALEAVRRRQVQLSLLTGFAPDASLNGRVLWSCTSRVVLPRSHRLARRPQIRLSELDGETLYLQAKQTVGHHSVLALCQEQGFIPGEIREVAATADFEALVGPVACGMGITVLPSPFEKIRFPMVVFKEIPTRHTIDIAACWRRDETSPLIGQFVETAAAMPIENLM